MRILIVDDDKKRSVSLIDFIADSGISDRQNIETAECLDAARELLRRSYFDVLILDVVLPKRTNSKPDANEGLKVLRLLSHSSHYNKPERIIGITAHIDDISQFRMEFDKYCLAIVEAHPTTIAWKSKITGALTYTSASKMKRSVKNNNLHIITIHGIRTFGGWQKRLQLIVNRTCGDIPCHSYKYGVFSLVAFFFPALRNRETKRLTKHLQSLFENNLNASFIIFSHSFGTYLTAESISELMNTNKFNKYLPVKTIVLSGSVLPQSFDWMKFREFGIRVVNDCADNDYVLYLSQAFIWGTGMAGKCGFYGFQDNLTTNRFFTGGHSSYFDGDDFMTEHWVPLLETDATVDEVDLRSHSFIKHHVIDKIFVVFGKIKHFVYITIISLILFKVVLNFLF